MKSIFVDNFLKENFLPVFSSFLFFILLSQIFNCFTAGGFHSSSKKRKLNQATVSLMFSLLSSCLTLFTITKDHSILNDPLKKVGSIPEIANKIRVGFYTYQIFSSTINRTFSMDMLFQNCIYLIFYSYCLKFGKFSAVSTVVSLKDINFLFYHGRQIQILNMKSMSDSEFRLFSYLTVMTFSISFTTSMWIYSFHFGLNGQISNIVDKYFFLIFSVFTFISNLFLFTKVCCSDVFQINILSSKKVKVAKTKSQ